VADSGAATRVGRSDDKQRITLTRRKQNKWRLLRSRSKNIRRRIETSRWCFVSFSDGLVWRRIIAAMVAMVYSFQIQIVPCLSINSFWLFRSPRSDTSHLLHCPASLSVKVPAVS
jgi:hypothetical protein